MTSGVHDGPVLSGAEFSSVFVLYVRSATSGALVGVWYHPNRLACESKWGHFNDFGAASSMFVHEIVEYVKRVP